MTRPDSLASALERAVALVALVVLSPLLAAIAVCIRVSSSGPVLFRQVRVGLDGEHFHILKFRTMVVGAAQMAADISPSGDPRVTRVGRILRASYLDELPQLVNILRGEMSLVGPRPETPQFVALYDDAERRVLTVRPGLVGPSTLAFMDEGARLAGSADPEGYYRSTLLHERVRLDLAYLDRRSIGTDLRLLVRQAVAIVLRT